MGAMAGAPQCVLSRRFHIDDDPSEGLRTAARLRSGELQICRATENEDSSSSSSSNSSNSSSSSSVNGSVNGSRRKRWKSPFKLNDDELDIRFGDLFSEGGKQPEVEFRPPLDPDSKLGYRKPVRGFLTEITPLAVKLRGDVRKCCCLVAGGVYENLLFFPVIELLKERYPGVLIDTITSERGKQVYEMNKFVHNAWVFDIESTFTRPSDYMELLGTLKNEYYDLIVSTKLAGIGHASLLWLTDCTRKVGYLYPNANGAGGGAFLSEPIIAPRLNLAEGGYHMYHELCEELGKPAKGVEKIDPRPLKVGISNRLRGVIETKWSEAELERGEFIVFHGLSSDSAATMKATGDPDCLLPLEVWNLLAKCCSKKVAFVIPHERERIKVQRAIGSTAHIIFVTTPGQLGALINDAFGVVTTNTAALPLALSMKKPCVALFSSVDKPELFLPSWADKCTPVASKTGKLEDINVKEAIHAIETVFSRAKVSAA